MVLRLFTTASESLRISCISCKQVLERGMAAGSHDALTVIFTVNVDHVISVFNVLVVKIAHAAATTALFVDGNDDAKGTVLHCGIGGENHGSGNADAVIGAKGGAGGVEIVVHNYVRSMIMTVREPEVQWFPDGLNMSGYLRLSSIVICDKMQQ